MCAAFEPGAIADPQHVGAGVVPLAGERILPGQRLLVGEQQRLVAGVELRALELRHGLRIDTARFHEVERFADAVRYVLESLGPGAAPHELERPPVDLAQVGIAARGERAQQVQRRRRLAVGSQHAHRIVAPRLGGELDAVDVVAEVARQRHFTLRFGRRAARLGELSRHATDLHHRQLAGERQHDRHLQQHAERVADVVRMELGEALGAVTALEQESLAGDDLGQLGLERARLAGEDQRRKVGDGRLGPGQPRRVLVHGQMPCLVSLPAIGCPGRLHFEYPLFAQCARPYPPRGRGANVTSVIASRGGSACFQSPPLAVVESGTTATRKPSCAPR